MTGDPVIADLREQITDADRAVLDAINERLALVARLKAYKDENGIGFLDPDRERRLLAHLREVNPGPLSPEGVDELFGAILELVKRELERA